MFGYRRIYKCGFGRVPACIAILCLVRFVAHANAGSRRPWFWRRGANEREYGIDPTYLSPASARARMGVNSFIVAVSSAAGPTIAAAILSIASSKWLFLINVPLGIVALLLAMRFCQPMRPAALNHALTCPVR